MARPAPARRALYVAGALTTLAVLLVFPSLLRSVTNSMLFYPARGQAMTPDRVGLEYEDLWLVAEDGTRTQAWWMPHPGADTCVLMFHGNAGTMADRLGHMKPLWDLGVSILAAEYRGYGDSDGAPSEEGLADDARAALAEAWRRCDRVVVHGRSLGGAVAIRLADDAQAGGTPLSGLIVESTFTSLQEMAGRSGIPFASRLVSYEFASLARVARVRAPLLVVHGTEDALIPLAMGQALFEAAPGPTTFLPVPGGTHNDTWVVGGSEYWSTLSAFFASL